MNKKVEYQNDPGRGLRLGFLILMNAATAGVVLLSVFVIAVKGASYDFKSNYMVFLGANLAWIAAPLVGAMMILIAQNMQHITAAVYQLACIVVCAMCFIALKRTFTDSTSMSAFDWLLVLSVSMVGMLVQTRAVARKLVKLDGVACSWSEGISGQVGGTVAVSHGVAVTIKILPLLYFILYLQLLAHVYECILKVASNPTQPLPELLVTLVCLPLFFGLFWLLQRYMVDAGVPKEPLTVHLQEMLAGKNMQKVWQGALYLFIVSFALASLVTFYLKIYLIAALCVAATWPLIGLLDRQLKESKKGENLHHD